MPDINFRTAMIVIFAIIIILMVVALVSKLFRLAIVLGVLAVFVPIIITIAAGDGAVYVEKATFFLQDDIRQEIIQQYDEYARQEKADPVIDGDRAQQAFSDAKDSIKDAVTDAIENLTEKENG